MPRAQLGSLLHAQVPGTPMGNMRLCGGVKPIY